MGNNLKKHLNGWNQNTPQTQAADREAARELAKHIAENYMGSPEEAQAFIDKINKFIENSELLEKGYVDRGNRLVPPNPSSDDDHTSSGWTVPGGLLGKKRKI